MKMGQKFYSLTMQRGDLNVVTHRELLKTNKLLIKSTGMTKGVGETMSSKSILY